MKNTDVNKNDDIRAAQLADVVAEEVRQSILEFITTIRKGSVKTNGIITIDELERNWDILDAKTKETYARIIGEELSSINEKPLIESKKESSKKGG